MARVKLSEYRAKSLLIDDYNGVPIKLDSGNNDCAELKDKVRYAIKVDQGIKKRGKQGLIKFDVVKKDAVSAVKTLAEKGYTRFVAEPMFEHENEDEQYLSLERTREGMKILYSTQGGVDVEDNPDKIKEYDSSENVPLPKDFMPRIIDVMDRENLSFVEINPLVVNGKNCTLLDAAVLADSAAESISTWTLEDIVEAHSHTLAETAIAKLNDNSPASFSFKILNPDGALWMMLSGGGASITIADEAHNHGKANLIGNYGEYSGGPTTEETYLYAKAVLEQMRQSKAKKKALIIAGGVANFTDVKKTFAGLIKALEEDVKIHGVKNLRVFVRRGGPNEKEGLALMESFLKKHQIYGSVHGSDVVLTEVVTEALEYVHA